MDHAIIKNITSKNNIEDYFLIFKNFYVIKKI